MASHTSPRPHLYALLVGINNYAPPIPALRGCLNDLQKVVSYLEKESVDFEVHIHTLTDGQATKNNIVNAITTHYEPAGENDVVFFYFSGHGTQEEADPVFWPVEEDHKLESIVCYDGYTLSDGKAKFNLLADKELRYLISKVAKKGSHILTIFDCCHSGGNTRNGFVLGLGEDALERRMICRERLSQAFPARPWEDFIFSKTISFDEVKINSITQYLAEGKHIQMAACQHDESAFEVGGEGVFTKNLLEILTRSEGLVTYYDLQARIQNYLRYQFRQTPRTYVSGDDESSLFLGFLNKKGGGKPLYGNISFNQTEGWIIDFGSMHGLSHESTINVITTNSQESYVAKLQELYPTHAQLTFEKQDNDKLDQRLSYKGYSTDYLFTTLKIYIDVKDNEIKGDLVASLSSAPGKNLMITELQREADYCIEQEGKEVFVSRPEMSSVPIILPVNYTSNNSATIIRNYLQHLAQFEFVKNLQNPNPILFSRFPVEISFYQKNAIQRDEEIKIEEGAIRPRFAGKEGSISDHSIKIKLRNTSDRKLYCALLYLDFNFGVYLKLLNEVVVGIDRNTEVWAWDGAFIPLKLEEEIAGYNYKECVTTIKLMVSTSDFKQQVTRFEMPPLPGPMSRGDKGLQVSTNNYIPEIQDWITRNIDIKIKNPYHKV